MRFLLFTLVVVLAGCGGSRDKAKPEAQPSGAAKPPADARKVLVAFGDSLTAGFGADPGKSYPDYLQKELDAKNIPYRVINAGVSGDTTTDGLARAGEVLGYNPDVVIVEFGGNDGLRGLPVETTRTNLDQIMGVLQKSGAKLVLAGMTLPPNYGPEYIKPFEKVYKDLAAKYRTPLIPFLLEGVGGHPSLMQQDGIHPTAEGNRIVAGTVMRVVERAVEK